MTPGNYQPTLAGLWALAALVEEAPVEDMLAAAERADAVGWALDPTLYRDKVRALHEDMEMLGSLRGVQDTVRRLRRRRAGA